MEKGECGDKFVYSRAVVCEGVASTLPEAALRMEEPSKVVDLEKARSQHREYTKVLKQLVKEVHVIPVDDKYPDCVFVEDPVVACGDTALLPILGHESRRGEKGAMKRVMEQLGLKVVEMVEPGRLDGGDVLFTGREFFVGQSTRTNESGLSQLAAAFPAYPVTGIPVQQGLHLKSFLTMAGPDLVAVSTSPAASAVRELMEKEGRFKYTYLELPEDTGANCLYLNNTLIHACGEWLPDSCRRYEELQTSAKKVALNNSELSKVDGCLTCCSVLIQ